MLWEALCVLLKPPKKTYFWYWGHELKKVLSWLTEKNKHFPSYLYPTRPPGSVWVSWATRLDKDIAATRLQLEDDIEYKNIAATRLKLEDDRIQEYCCYSSKISGW